MAMNFVDGREDDGGEQRREKEENVNVLFF
jgi:hypothetical protein